MPPRLRHNQITSIYSLALLPPPSPPLCLLAQSRRFSATSHANHLPSQRSVFFTWVNGPGAVFKQAGEEGPKYISAYDKYTWERKELETDSPALVTPYPHNRSFRSQPVLSDQMREEIYSRVQIQGKSVRQVSAELAVSLDRVAAVVRLKAVEKEWVDNGKHISTFLTAALERMLPVTHLSWQQQQIHENIQDLPAHPLASRQAFVPVSESREFTRVDAGKEFGLAPAEEVVPHPELVVLKRERLEILTDNERAARQQERERIADGQRVEREAKAKLRAEQEGRVIERGRWKWKLREATAGRVGHRYGFPLPDRKRGHVKIPTHVV